MKTKIKAVRQDGNYLFDNIIKYNNNSLENEKRIKKQYEVEFSEQSGFLFLSFQKKEAGEKEDEITMTISGLFKERNREYKEILSKIFLAIGVSFSGPDHLFEELIYTLSRPYLENDSIADFTLIEYTDGTTRLISQPEMQNEKAN